MNYKKGKLKREIITFLLVILITQLGISQTGRKVESFNEGWQFKKGPFTTDNIAFMQDWDKKWTDVKIPHTYNAKDMQVEHGVFYQGVAYYKKSFLVDEALKDKRLFLKFEGVGQVADLYVNGVFVGNHKGGYSAFSFEITKAVNFGEENTFVLKVNNEARQDVIPINHNLFGVYGGIHRPVWLITTNQINIDVTDHASNGVYISQEVIDNKKANVSVKLKLSSKLKNLQQVNLEHKIYNQEGKLVTKKDEKVSLSPQGVQIFTTSLTLNKPHLWQGRKDPYLYKVVTTITEGNAVLDEITQPLGIRKVEVVAGEGVFLNGEKYPMYGVCRHQDWWGIGNALEKEQHDIDLEMIMEMGVTTVRLAHYQQSEYFYAKCDSLGLLVWAEIPFVNRVSGQESDNAKSQLADLIRQNYNHPSIYVWGLHNEVYKPHDYTAQLTKELHDLAKSEDPERFTVAVNGYGHMDHPVNLNADIQGMNRYYGWYEGKVDGLDTWAKGIQQNYPEYKVMLTEYGAGGNPNHQTEFLGDTWNYTLPFYPETYQTKTHEIQYGHIKNNPNILSSYVWNMFDFCVPKWNNGGIEARNHKGLVTFDRKTKKDAFYWYKANWSKEPVLYLAERRMVEREKQKTNIKVYSNLGEPKVYLNGTLLENPKMGTTDVCYIFENVNLTKGENTIKAVAEKDGNTFEDVIKWNFTSEKTKDYNIKENTKAHAGF
ncbi:glycoside hydrolase family 2 protein [Aestuariibaculum sp. M13]|uniref:glycoside hydrolase family 2 protein n=1 Tax=Aestuariibaculum sp. M13 TaxID=2967132 RepID=UPI002159E493|nr:glycoside hydrolase family 2 protein [Aestuariibaculum sp. M13]MCR8668475.1 glycoside hydrolase family 2 protein [Aestuariibaculum sp. M13]